MKNKKFILIAISMLAFGLFLGYLIFDNGDTKADEKSQNVAEKSDQIWTCSMHPQIRQSEPGSCPICGMDLIPVEQNDDALDPDAITLSENAMIIAGVSTMKVGKSDGKKEISLNGKVEISEKNIFSQSSHIQGRIEKINVSFTGEFIRKGQKVASIYAPDLINAQQELLEAYKSKGIQPLLLEAVKNKLRNWKISDSTIDSIISSGKVQNTFDIVADVSGFIIKKNVELGDYVQRGQTLYDIADLSSVWILFEIYESDLSIVKIGSLIKYTIASFPGKEFSGKISFIDPFINPSTRIAKARVVVPNKSYLLKPAMFVSGTVQSIISNNKNTISVPKTAVMWTGKRSIVYVKYLSDKGVSFKLRNVTLGSLLGDDYVIIDGLALGEEIVVNGTFNIDAAAQLAGKPSMMNPQSNNQSNNLTSEDISKPVESTPIKINDEIKQSLQSIYDIYFALKDALTKDNFSIAKDKIKDLGITIEKINMNIFKGSAHEIWMKNYAQLINQTKHSEHIKDINELRKAFESISEAMISLTNTFHPLEANSFVQFCPMAFDNKGAKWLSKEKNIVNPYFGASMIKCGKVQEVINGK